LDKHLKKLLFDFVTVILSIKYIFMTVLGNVFGTGNVQADFAQFFSCHCNDYVCRISKKVSCITHNSFQVFCLEC